MGAEVYSNVSYWLALSSVTGVGPKRARVLAKRFGSVRNVFSADIIDISIILGGNIYLAREILNVGQDIDKHQKFSQNLRKNGIQTLCPEDTEYPDLLASIDNPSPVLYRIGKALENNRLSIAIVGTRSPTREGREIAECLAGQLSTRGLTIVSGLAKGIDTAAHKGTLKAGGKTIAVLGSGLKMIYPEQNIELARKICKDGTVLSECHPNEVVSSKGLMQRNRIISGLSHGVVLIEPKMGAMNTAKWACRQNRHIFIYKNQKTVDLSLPLSYNSVCFESDQLDMIHKKLQTLKDTNKQMEFIQD
ncbi:hypothetical protein GF312_17775 [Candidatus Poribacteria bacterium]|nr:hypothetical protein [Candidatus Poribacteria bacterium]